MKPKIVFSQPVPQEAIDLLAAHGEVEVFPFSHRSITVAELESAVRRSDYLFCMHSIPVTASMIEANPKLLGIACASRREDIHDLAAADAAGVPFLIAARPDPATADGGRDTANLMVALILNLAYRVAESDRFCRINGYFQEMTMEFMGVGLTAKTVSMIGMGRVARHAAKRLSTMDTEVLYTKRNRLTPEEEAELGITFVADRDELIARGDYVSMCANYEPANLKMMGAREFALMKPSAYFINIGRGRLVDEDAMIEALEQGTIAGAGLDVFWNEPPITNDPFVPDALRRMENVVMTPHNGGATWSHRGQQTMALAQVIVDDILERAR